VKLRETTDFRQQEGNRRHQDQFAPTQAPEQHLRVHFHLRAASASLRTLMIAEGQGHVCPQLLGRDDLIHGMRKSARACERY
jgi:hypothetical protein